MLSDLIIKLEATDCRHPDFSLASEEIIKATHELLLDDNQDNNHIKLKVLFNLMSTLIRRIPDEIFVQYKPKITTEPYITKEQLIAAIGSVLSSKLFENDQAQWLPSGSLSLTSAAFLSAASFERQFMLRSNECTLADLFELFKINIRLALKVLDHHSHLQPDQLKMPILEIYNRILLSPPIMKETVFSPNLIYIRNTMEFIEILYTIPLAFHAINVSITHANQSPNIQFHLEFYGEPRDRLVLMKNYASAFLALCAEAIELPPYYSEQKWLFECQFNVDALNNEAIADAINMIKGIGRMSFFDRKIELNGILLAALHSNKSGAELSHPLSALIDIFNDSKSNFLSKDTVLLIVQLLQGKELLPPVLNKLKKLINAFCSTLNENQVESLKETDPVLFSKYCELREQDCRFSQNSKRPPSRYSKSAKKHDN